MMKACFTLGRYMARAYLVNLLFMLAILLGIIYLFDTVELLRRASKGAEASLGIILQMGVLKLPEVAQILFPFAILFSAMFTFWQFNRRSELVVLRASGFSVWQFIAPVLLVSLGAGVLMVTALNPLGSIFIGQYERLQQDVFGRENNQIAIFKEGLWLRQSTDGTLIEDLDQLKKGYVILHARKITQPSWLLHDVSVFYYGADDLFLMRVDAENATLEEGRWVFDNAQIYKKGAAGAQNKDLYLPTRLSRRDIEESFSSPESMSFWQLPGHIQTLEDTGFDASRLHVYYHNLLSQPLFFMAMVLLAAAVSTRPPRLRGTFVLLVSGIFIGFFVFFMSSYLQALGATQQIPAILAAWSPSAICLLFGLTAIINFEDG